jgi:hypothetical protein
MHAIRVCLVPFSVFLARLSPARLPPAMLSACMCRYLVACTSRASLEGAGVWLLVRDKSHEIKNIKNYDYNFYFVQIQF